MNSPTLQTAVTVVLVVLLVLLINPLMFWMPDAMTMLTLAVAAALFCVWAGFLLREGARDEREAAHRLYAGRAAFLAGAAVLVVALLYQGATHTVDPWVPAALAAMVLGKLVARLYTDRFR